MPQKEVFPYCPAWVLSWHYRKQVLLMELRRYNADILCLQARPCIVCLDELLVGTSQRQHASE